MRTLWNILAILVLMAIAGTGVVYAQIFIDPQSPFNPFPPPTLPATLSIPSWTPTYRQLPATWTATYIPQTITVTKTLNKAWTPTVPTVMGGEGSKTPYAIPTWTRTPTITSTPTITYTPSNTPIPSSTPHPTNTPRPTDNLTLTYLAQMSIKNSLTAQAMTQQVAQIYQQQTFTAQTATAAFLPTSIMWTQTSQVRTWTAQANQSASQTAAASTAQTQTAASLYLTQTAAAIPPNPSGVVETSRGATSGQWQNFNDPTFRWNRVVGAVSYDVYFGPLDNGESVTVNLPQSEPYIFYTPAPFNRPSDGETWYLRIRTCGPGGFKQSWQTYFVFKYDTTLPTNPSLSSSGGAVSGSWQKAASAPTFTWSGASDPAGIAGYYVYFGTNSGGTSSSFQSAASYAPSTPIANGIYYLRVRAMDNAGNQAADWVTLFADYRVDNTVPPAPNVNSVVCTPAACDWVAHSVTHSTPDFDWDDVSDPAGSTESGLEGYYLNWGTSSNPAANTTVWVTSSFCTYPSTEMVEGVAYYIRLKSKDAAGNESAWTNFLSVIYKP